MTTALLTACNTTPHAKSPQFRDGGFRNPVAPRQAGWRQLPRMLWRFAFDKPDDATPSDTVPVRPLTRAQLLAAPDGSLFRLGHSTVLFKLGGGFWLTDPVFSERASPFQWMGPKRFHAPPIALDALPPIEGVILSHDHYDHLDRAAVLALEQKTRHFIAPLGVGDLLIEWGVDPTKVHQLDWWQEAKFGEVRLVATPAQHFSGRRLFADNPTLWASWVIEADGLRVFFSGDSGYFDGFRAIGERFGPFDLTLVECGAYDPMWSGVHMLPEQTVQAHLDLRGRWLLPVHNGTFDLALHGWQEPFTRVQAEAERLGVRLTTPAFGEPVAIAQPPASQPWWLPKT
ncbi:MBL fold metallo-hydrolase [Lysobacter sp. LF1]|uniref:MBL fold metallo-hydrolase n=1 Tax=Lysobacter stagni TaxID=3045172 RepID=A0ABT6XDP7_9GAMM|nr:MBL fold metallo-hydrolase [Lysobacter sp. LF1]MDI9238053.1 MBL fold metallo-hydrolase [Lysobacter sp. LF1]